jgi:arginyl-tRNA synthetase
MTWDVVRDPIQALIDEGLALLDLTDSEPGRAEFGLPERRAFGEITTTFAFRAAKKKKKAPRIIAEGLVRGFRAPEGSLVADAKTEGAGYVNPFGGGDMTMERRA